MPRSSQWPPSPRFPHQDPIHPPLLTHSTYNNNNNNNKKKKKKKKKKKEKRKRKQKKEWKKPRRF